MCTFRLLSTPRSSWWNIYHTNLSLQQPAAVDGMTTSRRDSDVKPPEGWIKFQKSQNQNIKAMIPD